MLRSVSTRTFFTAVVIALLLPGLAQAKRFKRYPGDVAETPAASTAQQTQQAPSPGEYYTAPAEDEEPPGLFGYALHGGEGLTFEYIYTGDVFGNARGGVRTRRSTEYLGLLDIAMTADLEALGLLPGGTVFMLAEDFHGSSVGPHVGDFQGVDNMDAGRTNFQLSEFWWEGSFLDGDMGVRVGKQDANAEFGFVDLGGDFIHASFGMTPTVPMPAWPDQAMGVIVFFQLTEAIALNVGVFDGAADGRTWGFSDSGEIFSIAELRTEWNLFDSLPGDCHVGVWNHNGRPQDPGNAAVTYNGNHGFHFGFDQLIYRESDEDDGQGLGTFFQYGWAPEERNEMTQFYGAGLVYKGLICCRDDDVLGLGIASADFSSRLGVPTNETAFELFYKIPLSPYFMIQPDVQYIANPSGVEADALIFGLRFEALL